MCGVGAAGSSANVPDDALDTNITVSPPNGIHNEIGTRDQLKTYDPDLAQLVSEVFGDRAWRYACPSK